MHVSAYDVARLQESYEHSYGRSTARDWEFHDTRDPLMRYLRDRRLHIAIDRLCQLTAQTPDAWSALVVCGGVGGEGTYLANRGCRSVAVSDFSRGALQICQQRDPRLATLQQNAEALTLADNSYDVALVQDGLHELRRPILGLTEMLRVARKAVVVIEPHNGIVARLLGTVWERHDGGDTGPAHARAQNYVFRWSAGLFGDVARSYLIDEIAAIDVMRFWDHNVTLHRLARPLGRGRVALGAVKLVYATLDRAWWWLGNSMVGIVVKRAQIPGAE